MVPLGMVRRCGARAGCQLSEVVCKFFVSLFFPQSCTHLPSSIHTNNHSLAFFMCNAADCLSKWVGQAEPQLRLPFDKDLAKEAKVMVEVVEEEAEGGSRRRRD
jgi:hypothetical protein